MRWACRYARALAMAVIMPAVLAPAFVSAQSQNNPGGIARPNSPRPPLVQGPADLAEPAPELRPRAQTPSLWQAGQRREAQPQTQPQPAPQQAPVAGPPPATGAPMMITPPGQRAPIRPEMNAVNRDLPSYRPPPPSYLPPKSGVVINPPSTRPPPPILRQSAPAPAMRQQTGPTQQQPSTRQPAANGRSQPAARTPSQPAARQATTQPAAPPAGFRPVPPRSPQFRPIGPVARPGTPTQPAPQGARQQSVQCTPQMVAARMCRP